MNVYTKRPYFWLKDQMGLLGKTSQYYRKVYDDDIAKEGLEFQIRTYYEIIDKGRKRRLEILLDKLSPRKDDFILDVGCGVGTFTYYSAKAGARSIGLDYSFETIKRAYQLSKRYKTSKKPLYLVADATKLPFKTKKFNKVICADFFEHISDGEKKEVVGELMKVVNSGSIIIFTPNLIREMIGFLYNYSKFLFTRKKVPVNHRHFGLATRSKVDKILRSCESISIDFKYIDEIRPYIEKIPILRRFLALNLLWEISTMR